MPFSRTYPFAPIALVTAAFGISAPPAFAEDYANWPLLQSTFESTGGGGIIISEYRPVIAGDKCVTNFTATEPSGKAYYNIVEFETQTVAGGTLCTNGKWSAVDGSASGTTPFRVFFKDGVARRAP
jgi:hypothetical protein